MTTRRATAALPTARVTVPRLAQRTVTRDRLLAVLPHTPAAQSADVLVVSAPAGYGKTTLLAQAAALLAARGRTVAWVTCQRGDDGPAFWAAVRAAVGRALAGVDDRAAARLAELELRRRRADETFAAALLGALEESAPTLFLVLDDVHLLQDRAALEELRALLERSAGTLGFALGCRIDPPLGLTRLRIGGRVREVRAVDLAFTPDEAREFWELHGTALDDELSSALLRRTEGWVAGMRLAALSLERAADPREFVDALGTDRATADYLTCEVLARLPAAETDFLLRTSVVDQVCGDLATRLTGREDAAALLATLEQRNALVTRLDSAATWFRYHDILRAYLRAELARRSGAELRRLHGAAARWYQEQDRADEALDHAVTAEDAGLIEEILRASGLALLLAGTDAAVRRAVSRPPRALVGTPVLLLHGAMVALAAGDLATADVALAELDRRPPDAEDDRTLALQAVAGLYRARFPTDAGGRGTDPSLTDARLRGLENDPRLDPDVRVLVVANRGVLRHVAGDYEGARRDHVRAATLAADQGLHRLTLSSIGRLAGAEVALNEYRAGKRSAERAIAFATEHGWGPSARLAYAYAMAAWSSFLAAEPEPAAAWAAHAVGVLDATVEVEVEGAARTVAAIIAFDDPAQRRSALDRLVEVTAWLDARRSSPALVAMAAAHELRMCLGLGEWSGAERALERAKRRLGGGADVSVLRAQLAHARGRHADAGRLLRPVLDGESRPLCATAGTAAWLLTALLARRSGQGAAAAHALDVALRHAAAIGAVRPFIDAGAELRPALAELRGRAGQSEPVLEEALRGQTRLDAWQAGTMGGAGDRQYPQRAAVDGALLTRRELQVLRNLPSLMTLGEIAAAEAVSLNTVKTHLRSIYLKLDVQSRRAAVAAARRRGLL